MTIRDAIDDYATWQEARGDSAPHRGECARILRLLADRLAGADAAEVTAEDLRGILAAVRERPGLRGRRRVSDHTVFAYWRTFAAFFAHLERSGAIARNPRAGVPKPRVEDSLVRPFTDEQVRKLLAQPDLETFAGLRDACLMVFLLDTGCRVSEVLGLTFDGLDLERRSARVLGKGRKECAVPFGPVALAWLERYLERRRRSDATDLVFVNQYGERLTRHAVARRVAAYGSRAGLRGVRASPHTFRHTFAVQWLVGDGDYKGDACSLQRVLGHSSQQMTQRYVRFTGEQLSELHQRLSPASRLAGPPRPPEPRRKRL